MKKLFGRGNAMQIFRYAMVAVWLVFTLTLTAWWAYFASRQLSDLASLDTEHAANLARYHKMLMSEGAALFLCLTGGAGWLAYMMHREKKEKQRIQEFLAAFTHELKTPLASVRLQAEILQERLLGSPEQQEVNRLLADLERLHLRLENSLFLSAQGSLRLLNERVRLSDLLQSTRIRWPSLDLVCDDDCIIKGDRRALEVVIGNIVQNSVVHGKATNLRIKFQRVRDGMLRLDFSDNGQGYDGNENLLGTLFARPSPGSGSGIGLHLVKTLCGKMGGNAEFRPLHDGFQVVIEVPGEFA